MASVRLGVGLAMRGQTAAGRGMVPLRARVRGLAVGMRVGRAGRWPRLAMERPGAGRRRRLDPVPLPALVLLGRHRLMVLPIGGQRRATDLGTVALDTGRLGLPLLHSALARPAMAVLRRLATAARSVGRRCVAVLDVVALDVGRLGLLLLRLALARLVMAVLRQRILVARSVGRRRVAVPGVVALSVG